MPGWGEGGARAVIDLSDDDMSATDFGACVTPVELSLSEPWNISIPVPYRRFTLERSQVGDPDGKLGLAVKHNKSTNRLPFLDWFF